MTPQSQTEPRIERVDPERLVSGTWCHRAQKTLGEGDIAASYSADRIGMSQPVRKPFSWNGGLWVCVSIWSRGGELKAEAYRLIHPQIFESEPVSYRQRVTNGRDARRDCCGFYHGMSVKHAGADFVLCGPPVTFMQGQTAQLTLF